MPELAIQLIPTAAIAPDPRNHNVMSPDDYTRLVFSIRDHGFVDPLTVREKEGPAGTVYETINGEHRLRAAGDLGLCDLPCVNLGKLDDVEAEQLAIVTNELGGSPDQVRLAERLRRIAAGMSVDRMAETLPYSPKELRLYLDRVDFAFANMSGADTRKPAEASVPDERKIVIKVPAASADRIMATLERVDRDASTAFEAVVLRYAERHAVQPLEPKRGAGA